MKSAIIGCGSIAQVHNASLTKLPGVRVAAYCDILRFRAQEMGEQTAAAIYTDYKQMIQEIKPDVVHICTPHYLHVLMARYAVQEGSHVFMEKPAAISTAQFQDLLEAEKSYGKQIAVCYQNRYNPATQYIKQRLDKKQWGEVLGARAIVTWFRNEEYYTKSGWRGKPETEGGGVLINQACHTLDLLQYLLGKPEEVEATASTHHLKSFLEVEDTMEAYVTFERDIPALLYASTAYCTDAPVILEIHCQNMTIRMEGEGITLIDPDGKIIKPSIKKRIGYGKSYWGASHADAIGDFYRCLEEEIPCSLSPSALEDSVRLMLGCYKSAKDHCAVSL